MLQKYLPVFLIFIFGILGCASTETVESTKVAPTEIYQDYAIRGSKNNTGVTATFRVGGSTGSTVDLDAPSKIDHNGAIMSESGAGFLKGTTYHSETKGFVATHKFAYTDANGKVWQNEISLDALEITSQNINISKTNGAVLTLSRAVGKEENVEFSLVSEQKQPITTNSNSSNKQPEQEYSTNLQIKFDESRSSIRIEQFSLKKFVEGKATLKVTVRKNKSLQQSAKGGSIDFTYESQKIAVIVVN